MIESRKYYSNGEADVVIRYNVEKANRTDGKVQNIASYINQETLGETHRKMDKKKALGVDGISKDEYETNLRANLEHLVKRMKQGSYKPEPSRRVYIPKEGSAKGRYGLFRTLPLKEPRISVSLFYKRVPNAL